MKTFQEFVEEINEGSYQPDPNAPKLKVTPGEKEGSWDVHHNGEKIGHIDQYEGTRYVGRGLHPKQVPIKKFSVTHTAGITPDSRHSDTYYNGIKSMVDAKHVIGQMHKKHLAKQGT